MKTINRDKVLELIKSTNGKVFTTVFTKKDGTERKMNCRLGVSKGVTGVGLKFDPSQYDLLPVYDMQAKSYRMINLETVKALQISKEFYVVSED